MWPVHKYPNFRIRSFETNRKLSLVQTEQQSQRNQLESTGIDQRKPREKTKRINKP
jgi:hypothetical protein